MDTDKAIKFLRNHFRIGIYEKISKEIIVLLKKLDKKSIRGEKYEQMWNSLYCKYGEVFLNDHRNPEILLEERMENLEQKYFPKEADSNEAKVD